MVAVTFLMPGTVIPRQEELFFHTFFLAMATVGSLWVIKPLFFTILAPWYAHVWERRKRYFSRHHYRPLVSIVIPAWNEEVGLVATLKTILASSYRPLEIVVINDGSTDQSDAIMHEFLQKYQQHVGESSSYIPIIYHYKTNGGKGAALNTGIALSHGEIIITFDADCVVHKDAVKHFVSYFADSEVMAVAGNIKIGNTRTILGLIQSLEYTFGFQYKKAEALLGVVFVIGGAASAFRREIFDRVGGYDTKTLTEDLELSLRIQKAGMRIVYAPEAIIHTEGPTTLRGLLKQRFRWKYGRFEALRMHRSSLFRRKGVNRPFFWIFLPLVISGDIEIILEFLYIALLYIYSILTHNFLLLLLSMAIVNIIYCFQLIEARYFRKISSLLLVPLLWILLQLMLFVELHVFVRVCYTFFYRKREVKWQKWQRTGVVDS